MRLTDKVGVDYIYSNYVSLKEPHKSIANKLGQLEDIEDELGIDLITLFNEINGTKAYEIISGIADAIKRKLGR